MDDVHKEWDGREIAIDLAGVSKIQYPIVVSDRGGVEQHTVAQVSMAVSLTDDTQKSLDAGCTAHITKPIKKKCY